MKNMRHYCDVYRPSESVDDRGQEQGATRIMQGVCCSVEPLNTREIEAARMIYAAATHKVEFYGDPNVTLGHRDYLVVNGKRKLNIGEVLDRNLNGLEYKLTCGEEVP